MKAVMLGYWVILVGIVFDVVGTIWDAIDDLTGEEALGGLLTPERLKFLGIAVVILGLVLGFRLGLRRRSSSS
jgi:uncharacterized membrane protein